MVVVVVVVVVVVAVVAVAVVAVVVEPYLGQTCKREDADERH